ncbi:type I-E CRISPR-associated protein Cas7/Cse4/CasC [Nocardia neocaledoniensis NBRC 108232]|uniref:CRISPR-associated Cse4 family protein n=1 Tax=Nocardia neocaledoniensis TaxID=236511 RepID=A0A317NH41_9NOCA|nr:type I-E CRISPR-associated protein Cas7/Cse4/CasC [Nocardia neocaledoniensis]PWV74509.1 CRISPR-associated Cse4 family protein [Nocardia neocaledoniensis]GEM33150.1 type I-E CRISPR-associated protein Cas7/Cse4/CasC [Nocardia neocaledoniensis NBRC 108232]
MTSTQAPRFLDIHLLQTVPYSNLNRDDLGSPKQLVYGGVERTRVSSQAWKRVTRHAVERATGTYAVRTRRVAKEVSRRLQARGWSRDLADAAGVQVLRSAVKDAKKDGLAVEANGSTSVLLYLPTDALDALAALAEKHRPEIEKQAAAKKATAALPTADVAAILSSRNGSIHLLGRMLAELPDGEVDGAVQVAHAFTTHGTELEIDFFTAVDDVPSETRGSGHMNSAEFSAGVFYRYANIDLEGLSTNLAGDAPLARDLTGAFLTAFATTVPTGKQTSTAAQTLPELVHVAVRSDRPVSLAAAFEAPVRAGGRGWAEPSRKRLSEYATRLSRMWTADTVCWSGFATVDDADFAGLGSRVESVTELLAAAATVAYPGSSA